MSLKGPIISPQKSNPGGSTVPRQELGPQPRLWGWVSLRGTALASLLGFFLPWFYLSHTVWERPGELSWSLPQLGSSGQTLGPLAGAGSHIIWNCFPD